jgi:hypothetical protein
MAGLADFNFVADGERRPVLAWALLVAGALALAVAADDFAAAASDNDRLAGQAEHLKRKAKSTSAAVAAAPGQKSALAERREAPRPPWDSLLSEIELAADARVALLSLDTDAAARRTRIVAEAKTIDDALAFAARLRDSPLIDDVLLLGHEGKKGQAVPVVGFTLQLDWSAG